jgi:hypothetical protein
MLYAGSLIAILWGVAQQGHSNEQFAGDFAFQNSSKS